jgi:hypothetical protein
VWVGEAKRVCPRLASPRDGTHGPGLWPQLGPIFTSISFIPGLYRREDSRCGLSLRHIGLPPT